MAILTDGRYNGPSALVHLLSSAVAMLLNCSPHRPLLAAGLALLAACGGRQDTDASRQTDVPATQPTVEFMDTAGAALAFDAGNVALGDARWEEAISHYTDALSLQPDHMGARVNRAIAHLANDQRDLALDDIAAAAELPAADDVVRFDLGAIQVRLGQYEQGLATLDGLAEPRDPRAEHYRATALTMLARYEEAFALLERLLGESPGSPDLLNSMGILLEEQSRTDEALARYQMALAADPNHLDALRNTGMLLLRAERGEEALQLIQRYLALSPPDARDRAFLQGRVDALTAGPDGEAP